MARVLILGGGFGGVYAALELEKSLESMDDIKVTLISRENFLLFTPMLHEVATGDVAVTDIVVPIRRLLQKTEFLQGDITRINLADKKISVVHCSGTAVDDIQYDYLLIALGSETNFYGLPGMEEGTVNMKTLGDAIELRNRLIATLEEAEFAVNMGTARPLLTYVVIGAGFAGTETVAAINDFVRESLRFYRHLKEDMVRVVLADMVPLPLPELGEELGKYAAKILKERKVELRLNSKVTAMTERGLEFADGTFEQAAIYVWTAGITPPLVLGSLPCALDKHRIVANEYLEVPNYPNVWALGDCSMIIDPETGKPYPPTAQHASRQGKVAGHNIACAASGRGTKKQFRYRMIGLLAAIGRRCGVASVFGFRFSGFFAWAMWRTIYLIKLPGLNRQLRVMFSWALGLFFAKDYVQFMTLAKPLIRNSPYARTSTEGKQSS